MYYLASHEGSYFAQGPSKPAPDMCSVVICILVKSMGSHQVKPLTPHLTSFLVLTVEKDMGIRGYE